MRIKLTILLAITCFTLFGQSLELADGVIIGKMDKDNTLDSVVVRFPDGTLGVRDVSSLIQHQIISISNDTIFLTNGGFIKLPQDTDADTTNEIQDLQLVGTTLSITNNPGATDIDLSPFQGSNTDEQTLSVGLPAGTLIPISISNGNTIDLDVNDGDSDPTNEIETWSSLSGKPIGFADDTDNVDDADADATNEIQDLELDGTTLSITNNPGATDIDLSPFQGTNTDEQTLSLGSPIGTLVPVSISNGNTIDLDINDGDSDPTNEIETWSTLSGIPGGFADDTDDVNDADANPSNELQTISKSGSTVTLSNSGGSFTDAVNDADANPSNEIQDLQLVGTTLTITNNPSASDIDLSPLQGTDTDDQTLSLGAPTGTTYPISIIDGNTINLDVADNDNSPTNEIETWATLGGIPPGFSDDTDNVDDADADATNEIQDLQLVGTTLSITNNPGATDIDLSPFQGTNTDEQTLSLGAPTGTVFPVTISNGNTINLDVDDGDDDPTNEIETWATLGGIPGGFADNTDDVDDADANATNEIQDLQLVGTTLSITNNPGATDIDLSPFQGTNTDEQTLSLGTPTGTLIPVTISNGNTINLDVDDGDDDPTNEIENWATLGGIPPGFADDTDDVDDADADATNEIQDLQLVGNTLSITNNGGATDIDLSAYADDQTLSIGAPSGTTFPISIIDGNTVNLNVADNDNSPTNEIETWATLSGIPGDFADNMDNVNDADANPSNELQTISKSGSTVTLSNGGGSFTDAVNDADANASNELQTISKSGSTVTLSDGGGSFTDAVNDADANATNEIQDLQLIGNTLSITNNGSATNIDLSPYQNTDTDDQTLNLGAPTGTTYPITIQNGNTINLNVADNDNSSTNEIETWATLSGIPTGFADNTDNVNDADANASNELQTISKSGSTVTLSNGGGSFTDAVNDADANATNEIQDLQLVGNTLSITNNGSATDIDLTPYQNSDTDDQTLSLGSPTGTTYPISIQDGNTINLNIADNDNSPTNEIETWATLAGIPGDFADNTDDVNDADSDATNEYNTALSLAANGVLSITDNGSSLTENLTSLFHNNDLQVGNAAIPTGYIAAFDGNVIAEEVSIRLSSAWPDYVFEPEYELMPIAELKSFLHTHRHLPGMPSAAIMKAEGIHTEKTLKALTEKVEELTLYTIQQQEILEQQAELIKAMQAKLEQSKKE